MYDVSLVIPVYNEEENIDLLFKSILDCGLYDKISEIIFIDDFSNDNSNKILKDLKKSYHKIKFLKNYKNMGQSFSIYEGAKLSNSSTLLTMDGDCQNNPLDALKLIEAYFSKKEIYLVGGIRKNRKDKLIKRLSSLVANKVRKKILNDDCDDTGCALKVFDKNQFLKFPFFNGIHRFLPALFKGYNRKTLFIEVSHNKRIYGKSKYGIIDRLFVGIIDIFKVKKIIDSRKND